MPPAMNPVFAVMLLPSAFAMLAARFLVARALGLRGVRFFGVHVADGEAATLAKRAVVVLAGLVASYSVAVLFFWAALVINGRVVTDVGTTRVTVLPGKPAAEAGMRDGDRISSIGGAPVTKWEEIAAEISKHPDVATEVVVDRGAERLTLTVTPRGEHGKGKIGVAAAQEHHAVGAGEALASALTQPARVNVDTVRGLVEMLTGRTEGELVGPVGIARETARAAKSGAGDLLYLLGILLAYVWPATAIAALVLVPRRARAVIEPAR
jgi:regulator of sigma E protease